MARSSGGLSPSVQTGFGEVVDLVDDRRVPAGGPAPPEPPPGAVEDAGLKVGGGGAGPDLLPALHQGGERLLGDLLRLAGVVEQQPGERDEAPVVGSPEGDDRLVPARFARCRRSRLQGRNLLHNQ